ncbi:MAG: ATP-binding protein [Candidatus Scalinduaceae bacterium]
MGYEVYLFELLEMESEVRRHKRIERLLRESRLPLEKTLDSFDMKRLPRKVAQVVNSLLDGSFLDGGKNN